MGIIVKNKKVNMPKGFTGNYVDHVVRLGIKRALQNKTQKAKKLARKIEREFSNDTDTKKFENSQRTWLLGRGRGKMELVYPNP